MKNSVLKYCIYDLDLFHTILGLHLRRNIPYMKVWWGSTMAWEYGGRGRALLSQSYKSELFHQFSLNSFTF